MRRASPSCETTGRANPNPNPSPSPSPNANPNPITLTLALALTLILTLTLTLNPNPNPNQGISGGMLLDEHGRVIGLNAFLRNDLAALTLCP